MNKRSQTKMTLDLEQQDPSVVPLTPGTPNPRAQNTTIAPIVPRSTNNFTPRHNPYIKPKTVISNNSFQPRTPVNNSMFGNLANTITRNIGAFGFGGFSPGIGVGNSVFQNLGQRFQNPNRSPFNQETKNNMQYNSINKKAFSNVDNLEGVMGTAVDGTFNRQVGKSPLKQSVDPLTGQYLEPTMDPMTDSTVVPPPVGVETQITPNYNINNY
jgi:hypothetical protein